MDILRNNGEAWDRGGAGAGGRLCAGFRIAGFFESYRNDEAATLDKYMPVYINTRALKPRGRD